MSNDALAAIGQGFGSFAAGLAPGLQQSALMDQRRRETEEDRKIREKELSDARSERAQERQLAEVARQEDRALNERNFSLLRADRQGELAQGEIARLQQEDRLRNQLSSETQARQQQFGLMTEQFKAGREDASLTRRQIESDRRERGIERDVNLTIERQKIDDAKKAAIEDRAHQYEMAFLEAQLRRGVGQAEAAQRAELMGLTSVMDDITKDKDALRNFESYLFTDQGQMDLERKGWTREQALKEFGHLLEIGKQMQTATGGLDVASMFLDSPEDTGAEFERRHLMIGQISKRQADGELTEAEARKERLKVAAEPFPTSSGGARGMLKLLKESRAKAGTVPLTPAPTGPTMAGSFKTEMEKPAKEQKAAAEGKAKAKAGSVPEVLRLARAAGYPVPADIKTDEDFEKFVKTFHGWAKKNRKDLADSRVFWPYLQ